VPRLDLGTVNRVHSAAIFDLDGVLVDSEPNHFAAERDLLAAYGVEFTEAVKRPYIGRSSRDVLVEFAARHGIPGPVDDLLTARTSPIWS
jgi:beta-phosphoglucomutase-like phosphatase (HAD superfamily)